MPQLILFLDEKDDEIIKKLKKKYQLSSKHQTIKLMIDSFKNKVD